MIDRRAALSRELAETRRSIGLQEERLALARAEVARAETIAAQGFLPRRELEARRSAKLAVQQEASTRPLPEPEPSSSLTDSDGSPHAATNASATANQSGARPIATEAALRWAAAQPRWPSAPRKVQRPKAQQAQTVRPQRAQEGAAWRHCRPRPARGRA